MTKDIILELGYKKMVAYPEWVYNLILDLATRTKGLDDIHDDIGTLLGRPSPNKSVPAIMNKPTAGNTAYKMMVFLRDSEGNMEDPANNEVLVLVSQDDGTAITATLYKENALTNGLDNATDGTTFPNASGWRAMEREATGIYFLYYKVANNATEEHLNIRFGYTEDSINQYIPAHTHIVDVHDDLTLLLANLATLDTVADGIQTDLSNGTDGLGALKALIDEKPEFAAKVNGSDNPTDNFGTVTYPVNLTITKPGLVDIYILSTDIPVNDSMSLKVQLKPDETNWLNLSEITWTAGLTAITGIGDLNGDSDFVLIKGIPVDSGNDLRFALNQVGGADAVGTASWHYVFRTKP